MTTTSSLAPSTFGDWENALGPAGDFVIIECDRNIRNRREESQRKWFDKRLLFVDFQRGIKKKKNSWSLRHALYLVEIIDRR